jgi:hypothetical protein
MSVDIHNRAHTQSKFQNKMKTEQFDGLPSTHAQTHSMRSMLGGVNFRNQGPSLKIHRGHCLTSMTKHDSGGSPPEATFDSAEVLHNKTQGSTSGWRSRLSPDGGAD